MSERSDQPKYRKKLVGKQEPDRPLQRVWELRERLIRLGVEFDDDDERIRKVVCGSKRDPR